MKKLLIILGLIIGCIALLAACSQGGSSAEITTSKSGKVSVALFDQTLPADKQEPSMQLTPTIAATDKAITDDGNGLYLLSLRKSGEGSVSLSQDRAQFGSIVTVSATPATDWRLARISVNGEDLTEGVNAFAMPARDAIVSGCSAERIT